MIAFPTDSQTRPVVSFPERVPESSPGLTFDLRVHQDITYSTIFSGYYCVDERFVARDCLESLGSSLESLWNPADWMNSSALSASSAKFAPVAEIAVIYFAFFPVQRVVVVLVPKEIAHTLVLFPAICFKSWLIRWRLATLQVERVGFPAGSRWSAGAETFEPIVCGP